jgi:hypothetical protein
LTWYPEGAALSDRARNFLRLEAERQSFAGDPDQDVRDAADCDAWFGIPSDRILEWLGRLRDVWAGISYRSFSWSFEEVIGFSPSLDCDPEDDEPTISLVEHSVAHPFGVWVNMRGEVYYMFPSEQGGEYIKIFDRIENIVESDSLYSESKGLLHVAEGGRERSLAISDAAARQLSLIDEGSGPTERWWQGDGFRVHVWDTWAKLFKNPELSKWAVWGHSTAGAEEARRFIGSCDYLA